MKKLFFAAIVATTAMPALAQISTTGLVAHWRFTGNVLDSSGNGNNGIATAITYGVGRDGVLGTAAQFNGSSSGIAVPYKSNLNLTNYSLCAVLKPTAFYTAACQASVIVERTGSTSLSGFYNMYFSDNAFDNGDCAALDTTKYTFAAIAGSNAPSQFSAQYSPAIIRNQWYSVVTTYNGAQIKVFVNGVLKATLAPATLPIGSATEGLSIGRGGHGNFQQNPFQFTGLMDDLRIYNRVLTDSEISVYHNPPIPSGVADVKDVAFGVLLQPNPATNHLTVHAPSGSCAFSIFDHLGRVVKSGVLAGRKSTLDISSVAPGAYFFRATSGDRVNVQRFVKQ